jgi:Site-specific recombinases, DNA invertase Pin homologs
VIQTNGQQRAAIYARVSTTDQADKGYALPMQIEACLAFAKAHDYTVVRRYDSSRGLHRY